MSISQVKVFTANKAKDRIELGESVTRYLAGPGKNLEVVKQTVTQSSDAEYHCLTIVLFMKERQ